MPPRYAIWSIVGESPSRYVPIWTAFDVGHPWRILDTVTGDVVRHPHEGRLHQAMKFRTPAAAYQAIRKLPFA